MIRETTAIMVEMSTQKRINSNMWYFKPKMLPSMRAFKTILYAPIMHMYSMTVNTV